MKQRFHLVPVHHDYAVMENTLNRLSDEGWEYRDVVKRISGNQFFILTKMVADNEEIQTKIELSEDNIRHLHRHPDGEEVVVGQLALTDIPEGGQPLKRTSQQWVDGENG
jgi:hypothetical protein